ILAACPKDRYGHQCRNACPTCLNGGVCHDVIGVCVCPPGFTGQNCEQACGEGQFGHNCTLDCAAVADDVGTSRDCSGKLFCMPDPYGCSCYPGYWGIDWCPHGTYGPDCRLQRKCHCHEEEACHPQWGYCANATCRQGFKNEPFCDQAYPALRSFAVQSLDEESFRVTWKPWTKDLDTGQGDAEAYRVLFKVHGSTNDWNRTDLIEDDGNGTLTYDVGELTANTEYDVRVVVHDVSGQENAELAPLARTTTPSPLEAPSNLTANVSTPQLIVVSWKLPDTRTWRCSRISVQLKVNDTQPLDVGSGDRYSLAVKPFTMYVLRVRLLVGVDKAGDWSSPLGLVTPEDAPEAVARIRVYRVSSKTYMLSWSPPSASNGVLRGYEVHYVRLRLLHECEDLPPSDGTQVRVTPNQRQLQLSNLTGGADYEVSVRATTVMDGPWKSHWFTTSHEEPDGPPLQPVLRDVTSVTATVYWSPPDCRTTNGVVEGYQLRLSSDAPWATEELINVTKDIGISMTHLVPFTSYRLGVAAVNSAGKGPEATLDFETLPGVPPAPGNLTAYSTGCDFIAVTWWAPYPPAGLPEFYNVFYKTTSEATFRGQFVETPTTSICESDVRQGRQCAVVRKLFPNTVYQVFVVAKNEGVDVWSDRSNTVVAETKETVPDPPSELVQDSREESSLTVSWKEPMISHGIITGYRVMLAGQYADPEQKESVEVGPEARNHSFLFLKPGSSFAVTVEAKTSAGYGKPIELIAYTRAPVPPVQTKVEVKTVDDTTITLSLAPTEDDDQDVSAYYVLVMRQENKEATERTRRSVSGRDGVHEWTAGKVDYNTSQEMGLPYYMAAQMTSATIRNRSDFTVGDGKYYGGFYNAPLVTGSTYDIGLAAEVDFEGASQTASRISYKLLSEAVRVGRQDVTTNGTATTAALVSLLVIVAVLPFFMWRWRKQIVSRMSRSVVKKTVIPASDAANLTFDNDGESLDIEMEEIHTSDLSSSKPIPVAGLQEYVQRMLICEGFKQEYTGQGRGPQYPTSEGQRLENRIKNRYGNQLPYDHSRVKLKPTAGIAFSDYINANYIDGYCRPKRYIATQGPRTNTVSDFWKMVWQENVCKIVMLTNLIEKGKAKCEQYWPDEAATYGDIQVHLMASETFPDYDVRQLHLTLADTTREVKHFHLRSWPDHGVPLYPNVLLAFRKKVNQYRAFNEAPVVVHCSAGVGRTGAYILLDTLQEQAMSEGVVDVVGQLAAIRKSRMNLVETLEQYNLVYRALMESICVRDHSVPCVKLEERLKELLSPDEATGKSKLVAEFQELNTLKPWFTPADFIAVREQSSLRNNKDVDTPPSDRSRPLLKDGTFVNAVYVNGFHKKRKFLVTQMPSTKDLDFWKLVHESGTRTIVTLDAFDSNEDDPTALAGCPRNGGIKLEDLKVECAKELDMEGIRTHSLLVTSRLKTPAPTSGPEPVKHFQLPTWSQPEAMVDLVDRVERWQQQSGDKIIFVLCRNGCSASGLFCCSALVLEKLKAEQEVDVFYATRIIRESRPQFIENPEQYRFCYDTALAYLDSVSMYANFQQS
ncbi:unnamed protein product, partial [Ixodes persulcatus]